MQITINGSRREAPPGQLLSQLVSELGFSVAHVAIEYNGRVLEEADLGKTAIQPDDNIEIVRFVGGG